MARGTNNLILETGTKAINEIIRNRIEEFLEEDLMIAIPARVVGTRDYSTLQCVDVQPVINPRWIDGRELTAPVIRKVFVKLFSGNGFSLEIPIAEGDLVTLHYAHKDLNAWLQSDGNGSVTQNVELLAEDRDCWVTHGFGTRNNNLAPSSTDFKIKRQEGSTETTMTFGADGVVTLKSTDKIVLDSDVEVTGQLDVVGNVSTDSAISADGNITSESNISADGNMTADGEVTAQAASPATAVALSNHVHGNGNNGANTFVPVVPNPPPP